MTDEDLVANCHTPAQQERTGYNNMDRLNWRITLAVVIVFLVAVLIYMLAGVAPNEGGLGTLL